MKKLIIVFLSAIFVQYKAQIKTGDTYKNYVQEGNYLFLEENYYLALESYEKAFKLDSSSALLNFNIGMCYLNILGNKIKAEPYLARASKAVSKSCNLDNPLEKNAPPLAHYFYGQVLHLSSNFEQEELQYNLFEKYISPRDKEWKKILARDRETFAYAKESMNVPLNVQIVNLSDSINSIYPDYSPVLSADERMLIFTTRRPNTTGGIKDNNGNYNEDVVVSYKNEKGEWSSPVPLSENINGIGMEASINLSPDGQTLIVYRDGGEGMGGNIYFSTYDGTDWSPLKDFGSDVNTKYWESHACLSSDGNTLIFVSDRPGGFGGRDIYRCVKLPTGKWSKALNMGPVINTEYDEDGAFIHPDGKTFFFISNGHKTLGGFDIMFATLDENNKFSDVQNMGYPINTVDDDAFYVTSPDGRRGYFSSAKGDGLGEKDIYMVSMPEAKEKPLVLFKGRIIAADGEKTPEDLSISVKDKATGEIIGVYRPRSNNGTFSTILPPGREYTFSYETQQGNEFYSEDVFVSNELSYNEINREVALEPVQLLGFVKVKENKLVLNTVVLEDPTTKRPIENAKVFITDSNGKTKELLSNAAGRNEGILLSADNDYKIYAELDGKKSEIVSLSTKGLKSSKILNQILYLEKKEVGSIPGKLSLDVLVKNRTRKPIKNATVLLVSSNGEKFEATTDENGVLKSIPLGIDVKYELSALIDNKVSEKIYFDTKKLKASAVLKKTLIIDEGSSVTAEDNILVEGEYQFYFKYNRNMIDENEESWKNFINKISELSKQRSVIVDVYSSASRVPTRVYKNNKQLAASRAKKTVEKITEAANLQGANMSNVSFKRRSKVNGPEYLNDPTKRKKYEPYQFVKAKVY